MNIVNKSTGDFYTAAEFTEFKNEAQNAILSSGQTLASDSIQLKQALSRFSSFGSSFTDSGSANTYTLTHIASIDPLTLLQDGAQIRFKAGNTNTGASTANVAGLGAKAIKKNGNADALSAGDIVAGRYYELTYNLADTSFDLADLSSTVGSNNPYTLIETVNISGTQVDFDTGLTGFTEYTFDLRGVRLSEAARMQIQFSFDGGASYKSGASDYNWRAATGNGNDNAGNASEINIGSTTFDTEQAGIGMDIDGLITLYTPIATGLSKVLGYLAVPNAAGQAQDNEFCGVYQASSGTANGVRFLVDSGTFTAGTIKVYGVNKDA